MKYLVVLGLVLYIIILIDDNVKTKRNVKTLQDSIVVIQKDLDFKDKIIKDYQSRLWKNTQLKNLQKVKKL